MLKIVCVCLVLSVVFGVCGCSKNNNKTNNGNNYSTNTSIIESASSKNNNTSDVSSPISKINPKTKSSSSVKGNISIDIYNLPTPPTKKAPNSLSEDEVYNTIVDLFEVDISKNIKISSGQIIYNYYSHRFSWTDNDEYPCINVSSVFITLNATDFKNLLNQLNKTWKKGKIDRMPYTPYEYEYISNSTIQKKYKNTVIAEIENTKTIYINKIGDDEYIAEFNGTFSNPKFQSGTIQIEEDGTGKEWPTSNEFLTN